MRLRLYGTSRKGRATEADQQLPEAGGGLEEGGWDRMGSSCPRVQGFSGGKGGRNILDSAVIAARPREHSPLYFKNLRSPVTMHFTGKEFYLSKQASSRVVTSTGEAPGVGPAGGCG